MWIEDCNKKRIPLSQLIIQEKARSLFSAVTAQNENEGQTSTTTNEEKSFKSRLFAHICEEMGARFQNLILHTEIRWLLIYKCTIMYIYFVIHSSLFVTYQF